MTKLSHLQPLTANPESLQLPLFACKVRAGFPSAADDFIDRPLDLNEYLISSPSSTFFAHAEGDSLRGIGIYSGDILIIDRVAERVQGAVVVAAIEGELTCKILDLKGQRLLSANRRYPPIHLSGQEELIIEGVVTYSIRRHLR